MVDLQTNTVGLAAAAIVQRLRQSVVEVRAPGSGGGAGIIWRPDGTIVTNHHVVPGNLATVRVEDGRMAPGTVVARDAANDLVVLHVPLTALPAVEIGDARTLRPGAVVLAMGHPLGVRNGLTLGVVSHSMSAAGPAPGRELLFADVHLAPGNSGGPLTDARGRVVGVNSMIAGGMALAVPSHLVTALVGAHASRAAIGLDLRAVVLPAAQAAQLPIGKEHGVLIIGVVAGSPAEAAGMLIGDLLVALDGEPFQGSTAWWQALERTRERAVTIDLVRGGSFHRLVVPLARPASYAA